MEEEQDDALEQNASFSFNDSHGLFNNTGPTPTNSPKSYNQTKRKSLKPNVNQII